MIEEIRRYKGKMSKAQKIRFIEFCLNVYTKEITILDCKDDLFDFGFCSVYKYYFDEHSDNFNLIPELQKRKPDVFYDWIGEIIEDDSQFWYPPTQNRERILICESILKELKNG